MESKSAANKYAPLDQLWSDMQENAEKALEKRLHLIQLKKKRAERLAKLRKAIVDTQSENEDIKAQIRQ